MVLPPADGDLLPASRPAAAVIQSMKGELARVYSTFITRVHRKPRSASTDELPILIGAADLPVHKRDRKSSPLVLCNAGLHFHNLLLVPPRTRLDETVEQHFRDHAGMYAGERRLIAHLDVEPVFVGLRARGRLRLQDSPEGTRGV